MQDLYLGHEPTKAFDLITVSGLNPLFTGPVVCDSGQVRSVVIFFVFFFFERKMPSLQILYLYYYNKEFSAFKF